MVLPEITIKKLKENIFHLEANLQNIMTETNRLWEDTGLDPKDASYLIEKTMRFEVAKHNLDMVFQNFKDLLESYKKLCQELEKSTSL